MGLLSPLLSRVYLQCSNAVFITHTDSQKAREDCSWERWIDGNAIPLNKQALNHTLTPIVTLKWITIPLRGKVNGCKYANIQNKHTDINNHIRGK